MIILPQKFGASSLCKLGNPELRKDQSLYETEVTQDKIHASSGKLRTRRVSDSQVGSGGKLLWHRRGRSGLTRNSPRKLDFFFVIFDFWFSQMQIRQITIGFNTIFLRRYSFPCISRKICSCKVVVVVKNDYIKYWHLLSSKIGLCLVLKLVSFKSFYKVFMQFLNEIQFR